MSVRSAGEHAGRSVFLVEIAVDGVEIKVRMTGHELLSLVEDAAEALVDQVTQQSECEFCDDSGCMLAQTLSGSLLELHRDDKRHRV